MKSPWAEYFDRFISHTDDDPTIEQFNKKLSAVNRSLLYVRSQENYDKQELYQLLNMSIQLQTAIALVTKLEEIRIDLTKA
ncbi:hypothetical protein [Edaphobacter sp. 12200R-103]|uniref:hypothetical protein n=1 Tax=Edaphobacter sp. 12200R-103 TaxID=2703788 RepID=UPI00138C562A|nr:hypothetical protein [Edaphobacter sp. 12200R-103]QHS51719.1 hypothetical protein GWR55_08180 [Edaphobacter sp. 12200R-103]